MKKEDYLINMIVDILIQLSVVINKLGFTERQIIDITKERLGITENYIGRMTYREEDK